MERAGIRTSDQNIHWPLITKEGTNDFGKVVHYFYNYSSSPAMVRYDHAAGKELITERRVIKGDGLQLGPWDVSIVEEN